MTTTKKTTTANRGMDFEKIITEQCSKYIKEEKAYIFKLCTDWVVQRKGKFIVSAFPKAKSLTDYFGVLKDGSAIAIEAKNTNNKTSFPLSNIKDHQFIFLAEWSKHTPHSYYLIRFKEQDEIYLVHSSKVQNFKDTEARKSIPYKWFGENASLIEGTDFLKGLIDN